MEEEAAAPCCWRSMLPTAALFNTAAGVPAPQAQQRDSVCSFVKELQPVPLAAAMTSWRHPLALIVFGAQPRSRPSCAAVQAPFTALKMGDDEASEEKKPDANALSQSSDAGKLLQDQTPHAPCSFFTAVLTAARGPFSLCQIAGRQRDLLQVQAYHAAPKAHDRARALTSSETLSLSLSLSLTLARLSLQAFCNRNGVAMNSVRSSSTATASTPPRRRRISTWRTATSSTSWWSSKAAAQWRRQ